MAEINIIGIIGDFTDLENNVLNAEAMAEALDGIPESEDVIVNINSPGGSVFDGFMMFNALKALPNNVVTRINGAAFSIASLIALAGNRVEMSEVAMMMIHKASGMAIGNAEEMEKQRKALENIDDTLVQVYAQKTGIPSDRIEELMDKETFFKSEEALERGFVDAIINRVDDSMAAILNIKTMKIRDFWNSVVNQDQTNDAVAGDDAEVTGEAAEETQVAETSEANAEEGSEEAGAEAVSREELNAIQAQIEELVTLMAENHKALLDQIQTNSVQAAEAAVAQLKTSLKRSNAKPPVANASITDDPTQQWVDPYAKFRAEMKAIDKETRPGGRL